MTYIALFRSARVYSPHFMYILRISWKYPCSVDILCILWKYLRSVYTICISCIYPHFMDIIRMSWIYPHFVDIIRIGHITSYLARNVHHGLHSFVQSCILFILVTLRAK